jgi:hypothetical protein
MPVSLRRTAVACLRRDAHERVCLILEPGSLSLNGPRHLPRYANKVKLTANKDLDLDVGYLLYLLLKLELSTERSPV